MKHFTYLTGAFLITGSLVACNQSSKSTTNNEKFVHDKGVNIAYTDTGKNDTTLLFVHGWGINKGYWANQVGYFGQHFRVVTIDLPGFGQSGKNRAKWGTADFAADVDSVIAQLHLKKVILIGHSMAGDIVLQSAIDNPDKVIGVVGVDNFMSVGEPQTEADKKSFANAMAAMRKDFKPVVTEYFNKILFSKTTPEDVKTHVLKDATSVDPNIGVSVMEQTEGFDEMAKLKQYGKKIYLINSNTHPNVHKNMDAQKIPYLFFYTDGTGHFSFVETPYDFNKDLREVIADIDHK